MNKQDYLNEKTDSEFESVILYKKDKNGNKLSTEDMDTFFYKHLLNLRRTYSYDVDDPFYVKSKMIFFDNGFYYFLDTEKEKILKYQLDTKPFLHHVYGYIYEEHTPKETDKPLEVIGEWIYLEHILHWAEFFDVQVWRNILKDRIDKGITYWEE